jgi:Helix-turn-helix domain
MGSNHLTTANLDIDSDSAILSASRYPKSVAFVHDFLDSHNLDPYEFRIYCHIVRRTGGKPEGVCFASLARIASTCKISERKTQQVLKFLIEARMITKQKNPGRKTDEYRVTLPDEWIPSTQLDELRNRSKKGEKGKKNAEDTSVEEDKQD